MKKESKLLKDLHIDDYLLSIRKVNPVFVSRYRQAYRNGDQFPAIIIEEKTGKIVSGNHRFTAMMEEFGPDHSTDVILKNFKSKKELLEEFAKENARHGNALDGYTKKCLTFELLKHGSTDHDIAQLFGISIKSVEKLGEGLISVKIGKKVEDRPAKKGFKPNRTITSIEYNQHSRTDRGLSIGAQADQLIRWMNNDLIEKNEINIKKIKELQMAIDKWL